MSLNNRALQPEVAPPRTSGVSQGVVAVAPVPWGVRCVRELAFHDWVVVVYLSILSVTVAMVDASPVRSRCLEHVALMLAFCVAVLALVRGGIAKGTLVAPRVPGSCLWHRANLVSDCASCYRWSTRRASTPSSLM